MLEQLNLLGTRPANVKELCYVAAAVGALSSYLVYGTYARQLCELLTLAPAVHITLQAANFLHDDTIRKLVTWHWGGKVLFLLATPFLEHLPGFFLLQTLHICPLLWYLCLKIGKLEQQEQIQLAKEKKAITKAQSMKSDRDTLDTTLSTADECSTLINSAKIFTDPPSLLASDVTLKQHYTKHEFIEDTLLETYSNELSQIIVQTAWGDHQYGKTYEIVMGQILKQTPIEIRANGYHPTPHRLRLSNTLTTPVMFAIRADMIEGLDATPFCGAVGPLKWENIDLALPVGPCSCNLSVDVVPVSSGATQFVKQIFFASTPIRFPVRISVE